MALFKKNLRISVTNTGRLIPELTANRACIGQKNYPILFLFIEITRRGIVFNVSYLLMDRKKEQ